MKNNILPHEKEIYDCEKAISDILEQNTKRPLWSSEEIRKLQKKLQELKNQVYSNLTPSDRVSICRHSERPHTMDFIENIFTPFQPISGDRVFRDDPAMICGLGKIGSMKCAVVGLEKGKDTETRIKYNFGMAHPEGYRKALRCMQLAEKFSLPIIAFIDTPGAYPGLSAEERGQGWIIAKNLWEMARLKTPMIVVLIGEGCSGGALGIGIGDVIGMLEHAYYSVISPEGCSSILWKDASKSSDAAAALKMHVEDLLRWNIVDKMIPEPPGGAHHDPSVVYKNVTSFITSSWKGLKNISPQELVEKRYVKFRQMGINSI
ncbi:MAG: acetyl-CoA carboxylase carboxyltransferase subunit alpha [Parachlamydiales bacterium]|nr:acetyl-CoA carboxylase carboxyltransferase subunit alpha [Parachlamydiales bacterium]